jgi:hypothetical protein
MRRTVGVVGWDLRLWSYRLGVAGWGTWYGVAQLADTVSSIRSLHHDSIIVSGA